MTKTSTASVTDAVAPGRRGRSVLRGVSGVLAAGQVVLLLIVVGSKVISWLNGYPGQGWWELGWHAVAAAIVVVLQRFADRYRGPVSWVASAGVIVVVVATLWVFWWL